MPRARADWVVALVLAVVSAVLLREALAMPAGPGTFPRAVALAMGGLSLALLARNLLFEGGLRGVYWYSAGPGAMRTVLVVVLITLAYVALLGVLRYALLTTGYFAAMMWVLGLRPRWLLAAVAPASALALEVLFVRILHVSLS